MSVQEFACSSSHSPKFGPEIDNLLNDQSIHDMAFAPFSSPRSSQSLTPPAVSPDSLHKSNVSPSPSPAPLSLSLTQPPLLANSHRDPEPMASLNLSPVVSLASVHDVLSSPTLTDSRQLLPWVKYPFPLSSMQSSRPFENVDSKVLDQPWDNCLAFQSLKQPMHSSGLMSEHLPWLNALSPMMPLSPLCLPNDNHDHRTFYPRQSYPGSSHPAPAPAPVPPRPPQALYYRRSRRYHERYNDDHHSSFLDRYEVPGSNGGWHDQRVAGAPLRHMLDVGFPVDHHDHPDLAWPHNHQKNWAMSPGKQDQATPDPRSHCDWDGHPPKIPSPFDRVLPLHIPHGSSSSAPFELPKSPSLDDPPMPLTDQSPERHKSPSRHHEQSPDSSSSQ
ncbi:hypothetical protein BGZ94_001483, partial [Podila epigama]